MRIFFRSSELIFGWLVHRDIDLPINRIINFKKWNFLRYIFFVWREGKCSASNNKFLKITSHSALPRPSSSCLGHPHCSVPPSPSLPSATSPFLPQFLAFWHEIWVELAGLKGSSSVTIISNYGDKFFRKTNFSIVNMFSMPGWDLSKTIKTRTQLSYINVSNLSNKFMSNAVYNPFFIPTYLFLKCTFYLPIIP